MSAPAGRSIDLVAAAVVLSAWLACAIARAHPVGLSQGDYDVRGGVVTADLTFAAAELGAGVAGATATVAGSREVDATLRERAARLAGRAVVAAAGRACPASVEWVERVASDAVGVRVRHDCSGLSGPLRLSVGFFGAFERGHRHVVHVRAADGAVTEAVARATGPDVALGDSGAAGALGALGAYVRLGVEHILGGADHLLFLLGVVLLPAALRSTVLAVTAFTVAHSLTLSAAALGFVAPSPRFVEPLIALSVAYVGVENLVRKDPRRRYVLTFAFGLLHGFGFAGALAAIAVPRSELAGALFGFNVGVELGQLLVVAPALFVLARARRFEWFGRFAAPALNVVIAALGLVWAGGRLTESGVTPAGAEPVAHARQ